MAFTETKKKNHCFSSLFYFSGIFHHSLSKLTVVPSNACGFTVGSRWLVQDTRNTSCNTKKTGASLFQDLHTYLPNVRFPVIFPVAPFPLIFSLSCPALSSCLLAPLWALPTPEISACAQEGSLYGRAGRVRGEKREKTQVGGVAHVENYWRTVRRNN